MACGRERATCRSPLFGWHISSCRENRGVLSSLENCSGRRCCGRLEAVPGSCRARDPVRRSICADGLNYERWLAHKILYRTKNLYRRPSTGATTQRRNDATERRPHSDSTVQQSCSASQFACPQGLAREVGPRLGGARGRSTRPFGRHRLQPSPRRRRTATSSYPQARIPLCQHH